MEVAVVTGAARGIGRAIADRLEADGVAVARVDRDFDETGGGPHGRFTCDVADIDGHAPLLETIEARIGPIRHLVNNAGVSSLLRGDMLDLRPESFDRCIAVNLRAGFFLTQALARHWQQNGSGRGATIVNIGSANAEIVGENRADYCISKAGVAMMTKLFAARLAALGIVVLEIRPGIIRTEMTAAATAKYDGLIASGGVPLARWGEPGDVAGVVAAIVRGDLPYMTGGHLDVGGGMQLYRV
ncbi:MAG: 3-ketoacyl-ACP reductase [Hyphomicrobiaceae bacterium]